MIDLSETAGLFCLYWHCILPEQGKYEREWLIGNERGVATGL